ncbi:polysaccharide deacetylase family protein [Adhaeribacter aquaticus]|uniref:polysaccharide deacetylase family protein n=1 Tax=Adhaeribacter aquaticus TaxID=299567 RepID=UPI000416CBDE|nr:polysaccharide deacetylase family protein [Adhaeribacter aquaticus]
MRFYHTPFFIQNILSGFTWRKATTAKIIYLTFDDGPIPGVTEFVLAELEKYLAKATFFCVGENLVRHQEIANKIIAAGHKLGNHTHNHVKGWHTTAPNYVANIKLCQEQLNKLNKTSTSKLFRPPHGRLTREQFKLVRPLYEVIMWDVLTYDFDASLLPDKCLKKAIKNTKAGSIVVFHDSLKARRNLEYTLPRYLAYFNNLGYRFESL